MKSLRWLALALVFLLLGCGTNLSRTVTIIDGDNIVNVTSSENIPSQILADANLQFQPNDRVLVNGIPHQLDESISEEGAIQLQLRHAVTIQLVTQQGTQSIQSSAMTVGDILKEAGYEISASDSIDPPMETPITDSMTITYTPAREITVITGDQSIVIHSSAQTVGQALAEAGIPLMGLDVSSPAENEALPQDGQIQITRVTESVNVTLESIPFETQSSESVDVPFGQTKILQAGVEGVAMVRTRIRFENGMEVSRKEEGKTVLREPQAELVAKGTQIVLAPVGGNVPYQYWYATQMYATVYSPCQSGTGGCSYGTASGARAGYGIVAVDYSIYSYLAGMKVYIPGYGVATIGDTGGGPIVETQFGVPRTQWIDLGYDDGQAMSTSGWVTVYFLEPAPAEIPYFFK